MLGPPWHAPYTVEWRCPLVPHSARRATTSLAGCYTESSGAGRLCCPSLACFSSFPFRFFEDSTALQFSHLIGPPLYHVCICKEIWISLHSGALLELIAHHSCHCHFLYKKSIKTVAGLTAWSSEWPAGCDSGRGWSGVVNSQLMREIWAEILCLSTFRSRLYYPISIHAENLPQS